MTYTKQLEKFRARRQKIRKLIADGISKATIARRLKITPQRVGQLAKKGA